MNLSLNWMEADSFAETLKRLFQRQKVGNPKLSIAYLCRAAKIKSRGHLSDVMQGRRRLNRRHFDAVADALDLNPFEVDFLRLKLDQEYSKSEEEKKSIEEQLRQVRKLVRIKYETMPGRFVGSHFVCQVLTSFGLFGNQPTRLDLYREFSNNRKAVDGALEVLEKRGFIQARGAHFVVNNTSFFFTESEDGFNHLDFVKESLLEARDSVSHWFDKNDMSRFSSFILSVKREAYQKYIADLREQVIKDLSRLECDEGDMVINFNLQVFPAQTVATKGSPL